MQDGRHDSGNHPISENPEGRFFECDNAQAREADCQDGCAPEMEEVQGVEDLVERSGRTHIGNEEGEGWPCGGVPGCGYQENCRD